VYDLRVRLRRRCHCRDGWNATRLLAAHGLRLRHLSNFLASLCHAIGISFMTVILSDAEITVRVGTFGADTMEWSNVFLVKYSTTWSTFIIENAAGHRLRIPAQMNGLRTLCEYILRLESTAIDPSVPIQMAKLI
jgi:hypothetical protein